MLFTIREHLAHDTFQIFRIEDIQRDIEKMDPLYPCQSARTHVFFSDNTI